VWDQLADMANITLARVLVDEDAPVAANRTDSIWRIWPWPKRNWVWLRSILTSGLLAFLSVGALSLTYSLSGDDDFAVVLGSFGAEAVLLCAAPYSPFSQPRNLIGGHIIATIIGVGCQKLIVLPELAMPASVAFCIMAQMATDTIHPPGGGIALIAVLQSERILRLGWRLFYPVFISVFLMLAVALLNNVFRCFSAKRKYPSGGLRKLYRW